jgi:ribosomal protein S18 acetylase RimI-like enzyme
MADVAAGLTGAALSRSRLASPGDLDAGDLDAAVRVWQLANTARGKVPDPDRVARVREKLAASDAVVVLSETEGEVVGMALAEPGLAEDGAGTRLPQLCHISMVFVHPDHWGRRIGQQLLDALAEQAAGRGYRTLQLWTGQANHQARRLYERAGFRPTGRSKDQRGSAIIHYSRSIVEGPDGGPPRSAASGATCSMDG